MSCPYVIYMARMNIIALSFAELKGLNPKYQITNYKQIPMTKIQNLKRFEHRWSWKKSPNCRAGPGSSPG
jgi:hypothetical protein